MSANTNPYGPAQIDPAQWTHVGDFYQGSSDEISAEYNFEHRALGLAIGLGEDWDWDQLIQNVTFNGTNGYGCAMCGSAFAYGVVFTDGDTNIAVGHICAREYLSLPSKSELARKRAASAAATTRKRKQAIADAMEFLSDKPQLAEDLETDHYITQDIKSKLFRYGSISERQAELVHKIAREELAREQARREREAALAEAPALTEERQIIDGLVIGTKSRDGYAYGTTEYKMTVQLDNGNRVWGTIPNSIFDEVWGNAGKVRVSFAAAIAVSKDDEHFGFFKRPTKATAQQVAA